MLSFFLIKYLSKRVKYFVKQYIDSEVIFTVWNDYVQYDEFNRIPLVCHERDQSNIALIV